MGLAQAPDRVRLYALHRFNLYVARKAFLEARGRASRAVEDLVADGVKIDLLTSRSSDLVDAAKSVLALTQGRPAAHTFKPDRPVTGIPGEATHVVGPDHARDPHRRINRSWLEGKHARKTRSQPARAGGAAPDEAGNVFHYRPRPCVINTSTDRDCDTDATEVLRQVMTRAYIKKHTTKPERRRRGVDRATLRPYTFLQLAADLKAKQAGRLWRRDRESVEAKLVWDNSMAAVLGFAGALAAVLQNELCFFNQPPTSVAMNSAKAASSVLSVLCLVFIYRIHWTSILLQRLTHHLRRGHSFDDSIPFYHILRRPSFWIEALICIAHVPPYITGEGMQGGVQAGCDPDRAMLSRCTTDLTASTSQGGTLTMFAIFICHVCVQFAFKHVRVR